MYRTQYKCSNNNKHTSIFFFQKGELKFSVVVTGAAGGLGFEVCKLLAINQKANVVMLDISMVSKWIKPKMIVPPNAVYS